MMVERHYDDEALITLIESDRAGADVHLTHCASCTEKLDTFRLITEALHEEDVWNTAPHQAPVPETIANLRGFADRMAAEDAAAALILPELLAGPREEWMPRLMAHPEWRTAGVVRGLVARAYATTFVNPPESLSMTMLCTDIADHLDPALNSTQTVANLLSASWRERAYALFYLGNYKDALSAIDRAGAALSGSLVDEYDRARIAVIRSVILRPAERFDEGLIAARSAADIYERFGDENRLVSARIAEMQLLFSRGDYEGAIGILQPLERRLRQSSDALNHARVLNNLGSCLWKLGRLEEALVQHDTAAMLFDALDIRTESARSRWNVALILAVAGRMDEARTRFETLWKVFSDLGMTSEAALVSLDLAEMLLNHDQFDEVERLCRVAMRSFEAAGLSYTTRALTALAYIRETAQRRTVTQAAVKHVREYIRRLPQDGQLLFAPPPSES